MEFRTKVDIAPAPFQIEPCERILFVGSCFADEMGRRFTEEKFRTVVNPFGVMYNPVSILHTIQQIHEPFDTAILTLGTNHVYVLRETGEVVDNCQKRPQHLFEERELSVDECADSLAEAISLLRSHNPDVKVILTVSPIRYRKYGYHGSQLSKATLLLAVEKISTPTYNPSPSLPEGEGDQPILTSPKERKSDCTHLPLLRGGMGRGCRDRAHYFPAYEIVNDELRDYRFYKPDMLHPSEQAVEYIYERFAEVYFSDATKAFLKEWAPLKAALAHRPFNAESEEYKQFLSETSLKVAALTQKYPNFIAE